MPSNGQTANIMISAKTALAQEALIDTLRSKTLRCLAFMKEKDATIAKLRDDLTTADLVGGDLVIRLAEKHREIQRLNGVIGQQKAVILKMERAAKDNPLIGGLLGHDFFHTKEAAWP